MNELYFYLPGIILLGIITSYEDIKYGKIRNKWIIASLIYFLVVFSGLLIYNAYSLGIGGINWQYVLETFTNAGIALLVGYALWHFGIWTAGDGKLFFGFAVMVPVGAYVFSITRFFPGLELLINIFIISTIFFIGSLLLNTSFRDKLEIIKSVFEPRRFFGSIISLFTVFWIIQTTLKFMKINSIILSVLLAFIFYFLIQSFFGEKYIYAMIAMTALILIFDHSTPTIYFLKQFLLITLVWIILMSLINNASFKAFTKEIEIKNLKAGMALAETIYSEKNSGKRSKTKKNLLKKEVRNIMRLAYKQGREYVIDCCPEGLTKKDLGIIRKLYKQRKLSFNKIRIQQTVPFAPFVFAGVVLTLIIRLNTVSYVIYILH